MDDGISYKLTCPHCIVGDRRWGGRLTLSRIVHKYLPGQPVCDEWDEEFRNFEPLGLYVFAWLPRRCRNRKIRWLTWLERHSDGTYTLGNRAH
jgi:hypothetical protein